MLTSATFYLNLRLLTQRALGYCPELLSGRYFDVNPILLIFNKYPARILRAKTYNDVSLLVTRSHNFTYWKFFFQRRLASSISFLRPNIDSLVIKLLP